MQDSDPGPSERMLFPAIVQVIRQMKLDEPVSAATHTQINDRLPQEFKKNRDSTVIEIAEFVYEFPPSRLDFCKPVIDQLIDNPRLISEVVIYRADIPLAGRQGDFSQRHTLDAALSEQALRASSSLVRTTPRGRFATGLTSGLSPASNARLAVPEK